MGLSNFATVLGLYVFHVAYVNFVCTVSILHCFFIFNCFFSCIIVLNLLFYIIKD